MSAADITLAAVAVALNLIACISLLWWNHQREKAHRREMRRFREIGQWRREPSSGYRRD